MFYQYYGGRIEDLDDEDAVVLDLISDYHNYNPCWRTFFPGTIRLDERPEDN